MPNRRTRLVAIAAVGVVVSALTTTDTWSVFEDSIDSGATNLSTGERARPVDIAVAPVNEDGSCGEFSDAQPAGHTVSFDLAAAELMTENDTVARPRYRLCVRNGGGADASLDVVRNDVVDVDVACSRREDDVDTTCGNGAAGELSTFLSNYRVVDCAGAPAGEITVPSGAMRCIGFDFDQHLAEASLEELQIVQSDKAAWTYTLTLHPIPSP